MVIEPVRFKSDDGQTVEAELGRLSVPENRSNPQSRQIEPAFVRFKSTAATPGPPVVYLAGGPGGSGIGTAAGPRFDLFMAMRAAGDVIALDQRGVGRSTPNLECVLSLDYPLDRPAEQEEMLRLYRQRSRTCARHWVEQGVDLAAYNTNENADDVEALRDALGAEKIGLWSTSYGTHLALAVIRRHERSVSRAILAGAEGPDHTLKLPSVARSQFEALGRLFRSDPVIGGAMPDLLELIWDLCKRLDQQPAVVELADLLDGTRVGVTVGSFDLQLFAASILGRIAGIESFPAAAQAMAAGDFAPLARFALEFRRSPLGNAMSWTMDCASGASDERRARFAREAKEFPLGALSDFPYPGICEAWGCPDLGPAFRAPIRSDIPVLFISGELDGRTPAGNVEEIRPGFPNSHHVLIQNTAHGDHLLLSTPETGRLMVEFMQGERVTTTRLAAPALRWIRES
jgi:pimeloyl-ACP methyl ester carboxylesterase